MIHSKNFITKKIDQVIDLINNCNPIHSIMNLIKSFTNFNNFIILIKENNDIFKKFISICDIDYILFNSIINEINNISKGKYKEIYCIEYKLILIFQIRDSVVKWKDLTKSIFYEPINGSKNHYKSINSQYIRWCKNKVFLNLFNSITPLNNNLIINNNLLNDDNEFYIINVDNDLFIDSTSINNKYGSEGIVVNPELTKKNITKLSTISNVDGFIYSITTTNINNKNIIFNKKKRIIKTCVHDTKTIETSINGINTNINIQSNTINLIGDKGYIISDNKLINIKNKKIKMTTPTKKNKKNKFINRNNNKKLGYRYIVENTICSFKHDERVNLRKDRNLNTFMGWVYLSCSSHNIKVNRRLVKELNENNINAIIKNKH